MNTVGIIQARMGSTRLPGKVMLPLAGEHVLIRDIVRVRAAEAVDEVVVATSEKTADDIVARYAQRAGASVFRGSESDVLGRMFNAAEQAEADIVVRITGDCPLIDPETITTTVKHLQSEQAAYCSNTIERTFPRGLDVEAFTFESFRHVHDEATEPHHREHVTPYYRDNPERFTLASVSSENVFDKDSLQHREDLRLTLDEADDYELLREIHDRVEFDELLPVRDAIATVDQHNLSQLNAAIEQKKVTDESDS